MNNPNNLTLEQITEHEIDQQIAAGHIRISDRALMLGKVADRFVVAPPEPARHPGKFNSARDELLHAIAGEGWATKSSGDVRCETGWFARISNPPEEMPQVQTAFADEIRSSGLTDSDLLMGHFLVREHQDGFVTVTEHQNAAELAAEYAVFEEVYERWCLGYEL